MNGQYKTTFQQNPQNMTSLKIVRNGNHVISISELHIRRRVVLTSKISTFRHAPIKKQIHRTKIKQKNTLATPLAVPKTLKMNVWHFVIIHHNNKYTTYFWNTVRVNLLSSDRAILSSNIHALHLLRHSQNRPINILHYWRSIFVVLEALRCVYLLLIQRNAHFSPTADTIRSVQYRIMIVIKLYNSLR